ncbi:MAG: DUF6754 domain-containing protein [Anaerolineaceae bacterium]
MPELTLNDLVALGIVLIALVVLLINLVAHRTGPFRDLRKVAAFDQVESLMHESAEKGQRLVIGLGPNLADQAPSVAGLNGLPILKVISRRSVFNDQPSQAVSGDGSLACLSQMIVRGAYQNALAPELFKPDYGLLAGSTPYSHLAGLLPDINHRANAGVILCGQFRPETILALDLAERKNMPMIAMSDSLSAQAVFFASSAVVCLGEDYFSSGETLRHSPATAASLRTQDALRVLITLGLLVGAVLKIAGVLP